MEFNHIKDCWKALGEVEDIKDIDKVLMSFPRWSGDWWVGIDNGSVMVTNHYEDEECDRYETRELEQFSLEDILDKYEVIDWLAEHKEVANDFNNHFKVNILEDDEIDIFLDDILDWIYEHNSLATDFEYHFNATL